MFQKAEGKDRQKDGKWRRWEKQENEMMIGDGPTSTW